MPGLSHTAPVVSCLSILLMNDTGPRPRLEAFTMGRGLALVVEVSMKPRLQCSFSVGVMFSFQMEADELFPP